MHRSAPLIRTTRQTLRSTTPTLRRAYPGIKQDDPSLHPTGANSEAAKDLGPLAESQPPSNSNPANQPKSSSNSGTESSVAVKDQQQQHSQQKGGQQQRGISTSCAGANSSREPRKTVAEMDEELRRRMSGYSGDGGEAGIEYENGVPVAMKRGVRRNMFRYI